LIFKLNNYCLGYSTIISQQHPNIMRFHVIANPHVPTLPTNEFDAFTMTIIKFCKLFHKHGHQIYFYGCDISKRHVPHTKFITTIKMKLYAKHGFNPAVFSDPRLLLQDAPDHFPLYPIQQQILKILKTELPRYYEPGDIVCHLYESYLLSNTNMIHVCPMQFGGHWNSYKYVAFASKTWFDTTTNYSENKTNNMIMNCIISPWFSKKDYYKMPKLPNTFLYLARISNHKGFDIYLRLAALFPDYTFLAAGGCTNYNQNNNIIMSGTKQYDLSKLPNVKYLGVVNGHFKRYLLATAQCLITPVRYIEPFGLNAVEALLSGTPVMASRLGTYCENIDHGTNGYLCSMDDNPWVVDDNDYDGQLDDWVRVLQDKPYCKLNYTLIRSQALAKFDSKIAYDKYVDFFGRILEKEKK